MICLDYSDREAEVSARASYGLYNTYKRESSWRARRHIVRGVWNGSIPGNNCTPPKELHFRTFDLCTKKKAQLLSLLDCKIL